MDMMVVVIVAALALAGVAGYFAIRSREESAKLPPNHIEHIKDAIQAAALAALNANNERLIQLARLDAERAQAASAEDLTRRQAAISELVRPVQESLANYQLRLSEIETAREKTFSTFAERLRNLGEVNDALRLETHGLAVSLKSGTVRGMWGEVVLERVVELAGMTQHCDFETQRSVLGEDGRLRPDLTIKLPGGRTIAVDAKAPLASYIDAASCEDEAGRRRLLDAHARSVREHAKALARREYWAQFEHSPEFVVMFLPGEAFYAAALQADPSLLETVASEKVILASPTSLIALLKAAAHGWQHEAVAANAVEIQNLGRAVYDSIAIFTRHLADVGAALVRANTSYNSAVGSLESRLLVRAGRMKDLARWPVEEIQTPKPIEIAPRPPKDALPLVEPGDPTSQLPA